MNSHSHTHAKTPYTPCGTEVPTGGVSACVCVGADPMTLSAAYHPAQDQRRTPVEAFRAGRSPRRGKWPFYANCRGYDHLPGRRPARRARTSRRRPRLRSCFEPRDPAKPPYVETIAMSDFELQLQRRAAQIHRWGGRCTARTITRRIWRYRGNVLGAAALLQSLADRGLGEWEPPRHTRGRPSKVFRLTSTECATTGDSKLTVSSPTSYVDAPANIGADRTSVSGSRLIPPGRGDTLCTPP